VCYSIIWVQAFSGGFVGVDVFFVHQGFLITRLIRDEHHDTRAFSFKRFYVRRVFRRFVTSRRGPDKPLQFGRDMGDGRRVAPRSRFRQSR
jgi:hypothetical protein